MTTRKEKLEFIKGLVSGKRSLKELRPPQKLGILIIRNGEPNIIYETETLRVLSEEEVAASYIKNPKSDTPMKFKVNILDHEEWKTLISSLKLKIEK